MLTLQEIRTELTDEQYDNFVQAVMYENLLGSVEEVETFFNRYGFSKASEALFYVFNWEESRKGWEYWESVYNYLKARGL